MLQNNSQNVTDKNVNENIKNIGYHQKYTQTRQSNSNVQYLGGGEMDNISKKRLRNYVSRMPKGTMTNKFINKHPGK